MRKKDENTLAGLFALVSFGFVYKGLLMLNDFYEKHTIWFYVIVFIFFVIILSGYFYFKKKRRDRWLSIERIEDMQKLHWREFEDFIMFVLQRRGFRASLGSGTRDGGIDIHATLEGRKYLIQCKKWNKYKVSEPNMREFLGAISDFDIDAKGIYVTTSHLTSDAKVFAERNGIMVWDKNSLEKYVSDYMGIAGDKYAIGMAEGNEGVSPQQNGIVCDKCGGNMVQRVAKHGTNKGGSFLGCENYPKCKNIKTL